MNAPEREAGTSAVRRYRPSRSWPVGALALVAAAGAVLATGALSSALDGGPSPAFAAGIGRNVESVQPQAKARTATPAPALPSHASLPADLWQIQVGAFRTISAAEAHLGALESELPELARMEPTHQLRGGLHRVRIGGIGDEPAARALCARILAAGRGCFAIRPES